jgi:hypothetical protein
MPLGRKRGTITASAVVLSKTMGWEKLFATVQM